MNLQYSGAYMMLVCIGLRLRDIDVAWLSRFLRFSAEGLNSPGGFTVLSHVICWWAVKPWDPPNPLRFAAYSSSRFQFNVVCWWAVKPWKLQLIWGSLLTHLPGFSLTKKRESDEERIKSRLLTRFKLWNFWVSLEIIWNLNSNVGLFW